jgi:hypothetical protein
MNLTPEPTSHCASLFVAALLVLVTTGPPASASTAAGVLHGSTLDARGDAAKAVDVLGVRVAQSATKVVARIRVRDLRARPRATFTVFGSFGDGGSHIQLATWRTAHGRVKTLLIADGDVVVSCPGISARWDLHEDLVTVSSPTTCSLTSWQGRRFGVAAESARSLDRVRRFSTS